jgi:hypothetical protein
MDSTPQNEPARSRTSRPTRLFGGTATAQATGRFLRRQLWLRPIFGAVVLGLVGWWVNHAVEGAMREQQVHELTTILEANISALREWIKGQEDNVGLVVADEHLVPPVKELLSLAEGPDGLDRRLLASKAQAELRARLLPRIAPFGYTGYFVVSTSFVVVASDIDPPVGRTLNGFRKDFPEHVLSSGKAAVTKPFRSMYPLKDEHDQWRADLPTMYTAAVVHDAAGKALAVLGLRIRPEAHFTQILQFARLGKTGTTYAFDSNGLFLSQSADDEQLKALNLLVDRPGETSVLTLEVRDPQVDMTAGKRPALRRAEQPPTYMASQALAGRDGVDVDGYRDYRGVKVVGAWRWLPEYDFGVATEASVAEAFRPSEILRHAFWGMLGLLGLLAVALFVLMCFMDRQRRRLQAAVLEARQLGQYTLAEKLGAGGMGTVYLARHAMLRRPTAVKLLDVDKVSDATVARFEREVQLTSALTHPNTVAIFDYGRTPEGIFYYAMEYLEGINLEDLVARFGPLPEARVVFILRQVCGALAEAHAAGLVHRDVKPANIFLTCRGRLFDFVKVLDFGLVKAVDAREAAQLTGANVVTGTPLYLSPEAVNRPEQVDARSDVYAIGAVAFFLLTGTPVFTGESVLEICMKHVQAEPESPSARAGRPISPALEKLILRCLAKSQAERPAEAAVLLRELEELVTSGRWTQDDAAAWWAANGTQLRARPSQPPEPTRHDEMPAVQGAATVLYERQ